MKTDYDLFTETFELYRRLCAVGRYAEAEETYKKAMSLLEREHNDLCRILSDDCDSTDKNLH